MLKRFFIGMIRFYQRYISPRTSPCCRFYPTCSQYGIEAISRFGAIKGGFMTLWRILRCNPFVAGGVDPVPEIKNKDLKKEKRNIKKKIIKKKVSEKHTFEDSPVYIKYK